MGGASIILRFKNQKKRNKMPKQKQTINYDIDSHKCAKSEKRPLAGGGGGVRKTIARID